MAAHDHKPIYPQMPNKVHGLLITQDRTLGVEVHPGNLVFDVKSLFQEMLDLKEEAIEDNLGQMGAELDKCVTDRAALTAALNQGVGRAVKVQFDMISCLNLLTQRCHARPWVQGRHRLSNYLAHHFRRFDLIGLEAAEFDFLLDVAASEPVLITSDSLAVCARHTGPEILGLRLSEEELKLRLEAAIQTATSGARPVVARS